MSQRYPNNWTIASRFRLGVRLQPLPAGSQGHLTRRMEPSLASLEIGGVAGSMETESRLPLYPCTSAVSCVRPNQPPTPRPKTWFTAMALTPDVRCKSGGGERDRQAIAVAHASPPAHTWQRPRLPAASRCWPAGFREPATPPRAAGHTAPNLVDPRRRPSGHRTPIDEREKAITRHE